jgi:hypothetical protein
LEMLDLNHGQTLLYTLLNLQGQRRDARVKKT